MIPGIHRSFYFISYLMSTTQGKQSEKDILMEDLGESLGYVQSFISQEVESVKLDLAEKVSIASSSVITGLVMASVGTLVMVFLAIGLGFYLGTVFQSNALGFALVSGFFLLLLLIFYIFRKVLITDRVVTAVIHLFFDQDDHENNS